jgi:mono/diheme cytochrome c family protein
MNRLELEVILTYILFGILSVAFGSNVGCRMASRHVDHDSKVPSANGSPLIRPLNNIKFEPIKGRLERGKYLAEGVLQCFVCHSERDWSKPGAPPIPKKKGAGHVWEGKPWLVAPNITPDKETGAGNWTDDMLARAIREGISHDGRVLDSQMYYASYRNLSDEDLASVIVYLRSLKPIYNALPQTKLQEAIQPPTPLTAVVKEPDLSTPARRGGYLARIGTCFGCHTAFFAPLSPGYFGGGDMIERGQERAFSANLTTAPSGILSYYDESLFIQTLRTGHVRSRKLSSVMPWVAVGNSSDEDLKAIFAYLGTRRPVHHVVDNTEPPSYCPMCGQKLGYGDRNGPKDIRAASVDPDTFEAYIGQYRFDDDFVLTILRDGDRLLIQNGLDGPIFELVAISGEQFTAREIPDVISFVKNERGEVTHLLSNVDDVVKRVR